MPSKHEITRVRHDIRRRILTVKRLESLTPKMRRVILTGDDLLGFVSLGYDDHIKLFIPSTSQSLPIFSSTEDELGKNTPELIPSPMRDFTPRHYDAEKNELTVDFALHENGPATEWAARAVLGDKIGVAGPRGSQIVADDFDWYLFVGDETALPAISRRLEELRAGVLAIVIASVAGPEEEQKLSSAANLTVQWVHRPAHKSSEITPLLSAVEKIQIPEGDGFVFVACASTTAKAVRQYLIEKRNVNKAWIKAAGYWQSGTPSFHEKHEE